MFISENNISLRIAEPEDAEVIYRWENDRSVWRVSETIAPVSRFQIEQFLLSNTDLTASHQLRLMVELHPDGPIGCIDPLYTDDPEVLNNLEAGFAPNISNTPEYGWVVAAGSPVFLEIVSMRSKSSFGGNL